MAESAALLPRSGGTLSLAQWCHLFFFMVSGVATPDTMKKNRWHHCASDKVPPERGSSAADSAIFLDLG